MPPLSFVIFELGVFVLALICLRHAWQRTRYLAIAFLVTIVFSFSTEIFAIKLLHEYYYNSFFVMICREPGLPWGVNLSCTASSSCVPLAIPVMESIVIYAAIVTSDRLNLPWAARPVFVGLLAISIDLVMDPVVSASLACHATSRAVNPVVVGHGLGFWVWLFKPEQAALGLPPEHNLLFGVPLNNFSGWFLSVLIYSLLLHMGWRKIPPGSKGILGDLIVPVVAIPLTLLAFAGVIAVYQWLITNVVGSEWTLVALILGASILVILRFARRARRDNPIDRVILAVPLLLHVYFLGMLFASNLYREEPVVIAVSAALFPLSLLLFSWPYWDSITRAFKTARS